MNWAAIYSGGKWRPEHWSGCERKRGGGSRLEFLQCCHGGPSCISVKSGILQAMPRSELTKTQALLYRYLSENSGRPVSRAELSEKVWGQPYRGTTRTIDQTIAVIRKKLPSPDERIISVCGTGYCLEKSGEELSAKP